VVHPGAKAASSSPSPFSARTASTGAVRLAFADRVTAGGGGSARLVL
jgi:hypothetical protein